MSCKKPLRLDDTFRRLNVDDLTGVLEPAVNLLMGNITQLLFSLTRIAVKSKNMTIYDIHNSPYNVHLKTGTLYRLLKMEKKGEFDRPDLKNNVMEPTTFLLIEKETELCKMWIIFTKSTTRHETILHYE
ncbi:hypothetical protein BD770DRAFT_416587 [Pilaira anomala]|nr:hypothetical protein BD770DRAFT_416587 [Pilaira anomala]